MTKTLQITTGDAVLHLFRKAGLVGTHLAWRDALHEGPVSAVEPLETMSAVRADYLGTRGYGHPIKLHREFEKRDAAVRGAVEFDEIVLWFEHDLYDQLQLLQILDALSRMSLAPGSISMVQTDHYLGLLDAEELSALYPKRRIVSDGAFATAREAWAVFAASDPHALATFSKTDRVALPHVRSAFARLCEEFPGRDGLSRTQRQALSAASRGAARREELFRRSQAQEEAEFFGNAGFYAVVGDLSAAPSPLLHVVGDEIEATPLGLRVLTGGADWIETQPPDRYVGGTHVTRETPWRFDADRRVFEGN